MEAPLSPSFMAAVRKYTAESTVPVEVAGTNVSESDIAIMAKAIVQTQMTHKEILRNHYNDKMIQNMAKRMGGNGDESADDDDTSKKRKPGAEDDEAESDTEDGKKSKKRKPGAEDDEAESDTEDGKTSKKRKPGAEDDEAESDTEDGKTSKKRKIQTHKTRRGGW